MLIIDLSKLHWALYSIVIQEEGARWFARTIVGDRFIVGDEVSPWEALASMLANPNLNVGLGMS